MSRAETAAGLDRLPWLPDEPAKQPARGPGVGALGSALAVVLLVGGAAFWFGTRSAEQEAPPASSTKAIVRLPEARQAVPPQPQVKLAPVPEVEPIVAPPMPVIEAPPPPPVSHSAPARVKSAPPEVVKPSSAIEEAPKPAPPPKLEPWPVRQVEGAAGRLVRIGAFSSVHQAKRGWWAIVRVNPTLKRLPALVVPVQSLRNGRVYYRLQMGTTSQAHSAVLCQRMRMIAEPCVVIGVGA